MAFHTRDFGDATRVARGRCAYQAGLSAEQQVAARYSEQGCTLLAERWRAGGGELELLLSDPDGVIIYVEVKQSGQFDIALSHQSEALVDAGGDIRIMENFFAGGL